MCFIYQKNNNKKTKNNDLQIPMTKTASSTGSKVTADVMPRKIPVFALVVVSEAK